MRFGTLLGMCLGGFVVIFLMFFASVVWNHLSLGVIEYWELGRRINYLHVPFYQNPQVWMNGRVCVGVCMSRMNGQEFFFREVGQWLCFLIAAARRSRDLLLCWRIKLCVCECVCVWSVRMASVVEWIECRSVRSPFPVPLTWAESRRFGAGAINNLLIFFYWCFYLATALY